MSRTCGRRALVYGPGLPEFDREGGSRDIADIVHFLVEAGWTVSFVARDASGGERYARHLRQLGVVVRHGTVTDEVLLEHRPDLVLIAFWRTAEEVLPAIRRACPTARVVVSSIDAHFLRGARRIFNAVAAGRRHAMLDRYFADELARELNTYAAVDGVLAVSEKEAGLINDLIALPGHATWVPVTVDEVRSDVPFADRRGIVFVGNFRHAPNVEAVEYLCRDIVPRIPAELLDEHPVLVVGNGPDDRVKRVVNETRGARLVGWVPSLSPYLQQVRVSVVPLLNGAGVKGKLVQSLGAGTPVVSTAIGVEGLGLATGTGVLVEDAPTRFAAAVTRLLTDEATWQSLADAGYRHIGAAHARPAVQERLAAALDGVMQRPARPAALADMLAPEITGDRYAEVVRRLTGLCRQHVPPGSNVLVIGKGDDAMLAMEGVHAEHFPQDEQGAYLGWSPADGAEVTARLDALATRPHYLVLPDPSSWWLDEYDGLREYLRRHYELATEEEGVGLVWRRTAGQLVTAAERGR